MILSKRQKIITAIMAGTIVGGGLFFLYMLRAVGRYLNIFSRLKTYFAKYSLGRSDGAVTSKGFVWKAFSTTLNLNFDIIP